MSFWKNGRKAWHWSDEMIGSVRTNIAVLLINSLAAPIMFLTLDDIQIVIGSLGLWSLDPLIWKALPVWGAMATTVVIVDFTDYWIHRSMHIGPLWRIHMVHHSDAHLNHTTSYRIHILQSVYMNCVMMVVATFLSLPAITAAISILGLNMYNKFVHIDADIHFGPFNKILSSPRLHRWHHAENPESYGKNIANIFSLWDVLFGTYYLPGKCTENIGFHGRPANNLLLIMSWPFKMWFEDMKFTANQNKHKQKST